MHCSKCVSFWGLRTLDPLWTHTSLPPVTKSWRRHWSTIEGFNIIVPIHSDTKLELSLLCRRPRGGLTYTAIRLSVCPSVCSMAQLP